MSSQTICEGQQVVPIETFNQCDNNSWVLTFEDNFDGNNLDLSKWNVATGIPRDPYFEKQKAWHKPENVVVENSFLKIISKKETLLNQCFDKWINDSMQHFCSDFEYSTGEIGTKSKFEYGKFEARIRIPKGKGFWPAFWLFGGSPVYNEIDIFEFWDNSTSDHNMTVFYDFDGDGNASMCLTDYDGTDYSQSFHIFTLIWKKNKIEWYVDGNLKRTDYRYYTILGKTTGCTINAWSQYILNKIYPKDPMAIILNTAIQTGTYKPDNSTTFPAQMEIDWVRYYQRKPCQDINITDASQFPLSNQVYNVIVGKNVNINCNFTIQSGQQLEIVAKNSITLEPGFNAELGSTFTARIEPTVCGSVLKSASIENGQDFNELINNKSIINEAVTSSDVLIYPNPN